MAKRTSVGAAPEFSSLALPRHHRRKDDERPGVYRYPHQDQNRKHKSGDDEYPARGPGPALGVDVTLWRNLVHDGGLPRRRRCHTSHLTSHGSAGG